MNPELEDRILGALDEFAALEPEPGETWESWYAAAFEMARAKIKRLLSESAPRARYANE